MKNTVHEIKGMYYKDIKDKKYKYELVKKFSYPTKIRIKHPVFWEGITLNTTGMLYMNRGFKWNGADVVKDTDSNTRASAVHDALCILYHADLLKPKWIIIINSIYKSLCIADGMPRWRYNAHRLGLRLFWWKRRI